MVSRKKRLSNIHLIGLTGKGGGVQWEGMVDKDKKAGFSPKDVLREALAAEQRVRPGIRVTPLMACPFLERLAGCRCWLKLETRQQTGSFKARGAMSFLQGLDKNSVAGVVAASTGNHGLAVTWAAKLMSIPVTVVVPETVSPLKAERLRSTGATILYHGDDVVQAELRARELAGESHQPYVPPYNHPRIIGGQAGVALELERQTGFPDHVLVPVGGGGLISGVAGWFSARGAATRVVGCQPGNSDIMAASVAAGRILDLPSRPTLAAASAGGIEAGSITFPICRDHVAAWQRVSEEEIRRAMQDLKRETGILAEGAAAMPVAALRSNPGAYAGSTVVLVISGGNTEAGET